MLKTSRNSFNPSDRRQHNEMTFSPITNTRDLNNDKNIIPRDYDEDEEFYVIGERVLVDNYRAGSVAYFGETEFGTGDWVGVVLDEPTGNHDGKLHGREYFHCGPHQGIFVRAHRVTPMNVHQGKPRSLLGIGSSRTPTPTYNQLLINAGHRWAAPNTPTPASRCNSASKSPAISLLDSYYYDDDYRQDDTRGPSIASLAQRLKSIDVGNKQQAADRSSTPAGILKHHHNRWPATGVEREKSRWGLRGTSSQSSGLGSSQPDDDLRAMSSRMDDLAAGRLRASSVSSGGARRSTFSFRPRREPLGSAKPSKQQSQHTISSSLSLDEANDASALRVNFSSELAKLGDRVWVRTEREQDEQLGVLRFMGETEFATGEWAGVELDARFGKNNGSILGQRYFYCPEGYGLFVPASRVRKCIPSAGTTGNTLKVTRSRGLNREANSFDSMRSTILSPPPEPSEPPRRHYNSSSVATPSSCLSSSTSPGDADISSAETLAHDKWRGSLRELPEAVTRAYVSRATSISPLDCCDKSAGILERHYNRRTKFDERDLERELRRSSSSSSLAMPDKLAPYERCRSIERTRPRAKAVTYTFSTSEIAGKPPIANRTLVYE